MILIDTDKKNTYDTKKYLEQKYKNVIEEKIKNNDLF